MTSGKRNSLGSESDKSSKNLEKEQVAAALFSRFFTVQLLKERTSRVENGRKKKLLLRQYLFAFF